MLDAVFHISLTQYKKKNNVDTATSASQLQFQDV